MYCSTCGAQVPDGASRCTNCGAAVSRPSGFGVPVVHHHVVHSQAMPMGSVVCPRCGFQGPTVSYFSQGSHIGVLLLLAAITMFPVAGFGGLLYYLLRRDHRSCARCGHTLGKGAELALMSASQHGAALPAGVAAEADLPEEGGGGRGWKVGSFLLLAFAAMMMLGGIMDEEFGVVLIGMISAGAGAWMLTRARGAREERRQQLLMALQQPVLRLAGQYDGRLTVTQVASALAWPMRRAEKVLNSLDDGLRVVSDVTNEGVIVYDFRELRHAQQQRMSAAEMDALLVPSAQTQLQPPAMQAQPFPAQQPVAQPQATQSPPLPHDGTLRM